MPEVALGDSGLRSSPRPTRPAAPTGSSPRWGNTMRDGLGVRAERGGVELAITGGLLFDPVLGVRETSIGIADGRVIASAAPATRTRWTASTSCSTPPPR